MQAFLEQLLGNLQGRMVESPVVVLYGVTGLHSNYRGLRLYPFKSLEDLWGLNVIALVYGKPVPVDIYEAIQTRACARFGEFYAMEEL